MHVHSAVVWEKEADSFTPAHRKKHYKLSTNTYTHRQSRDKWEAELEATTKEVKRSNRTRQNNKRADRKLEPNDSPEIPDKGDTSEVPGLNSLGRLQ